MLTDAEAEAIRIMACLCTQESKGSVAEAFGCSRSAIKDIVTGKTHNGSRRGGCKSRLVKSISPIGREKRKRIFEMLRSGPKEEREIRKALGTDPGAYLTELRKAGKIERKFVWVLR